MKNLHYKAILLIFLSNYTFSQVIIKNYNQTNNKIDFEFSLSSIPSQKTVSGTESFVSFNGFRDESSPGKPALPKRNIIIALPSYSKVSVVLNPLSGNKIKGKPLQTLRWHLIKMVMWLIKIRREQQPIVNRSSLR